MSDFSENFDDDQDVLFEVQIRFPGYRWKAKRVFDLQYQFNSLLLGHLRDAGFCEEDLTTTSRDSHDLTETSENTSSTNHRNVSPQTFKTWLTSHVWKFFGLDISCEQSRCMYDCTAIVKLVLNAGILDKEDATVLHNLFHNEFIVENNIVALPSILNYGCRLFGVFSLTSLCLLQHKFFPASFLTRKLSSHSFIRPAVLSLTSGYVIYIVPQLCLRMNHVILQRKRYYLVKQLVSETYKWQKCCRKSLRLIRELELVSRGFTLMSARIPVQRLELGEHQTCPRQASQLRKMLFTSTRKVLLDSKEATQRLLECIPQTSEMKDSCCWLANIALTDYGELITEQDDAKLNVLTEQYSLKCLMAINEYSLLQVSEFVRLLCQMFLQGIITTEIGPLIKKLTSIIAHRFSELSLSYEYLQCTIAEPSSLTTSMYNSGVDLDTQSVHYVAVHSLTLHLQAALHRVKKLEQILEGPKQDAQLDEHSDDLSSIHRELDSCTDCWQELMTIIQKAKNRPTDAPTPHPPAVLQPVTEAKDPVPLFDLGDPVILDQVFQAVTDGKDKKNTKQEQLETTEDKESAQVQQKEATRVMKELRKVIVVRADDWAERERKALQRDQSSVAQADGPWLLAGQENVAGRDVDHLKEEVPRSDCDVQGKREESEGSVGEDRSRCVDPDAGPDAGCDNAAGVATTFELEDQSAVPIIVPKDLNVHNDNVDISSMFVGPIKLNDISKARAKMIGNAENSPVTNKLSEFSNLDEVESDADSDHDPLEYFSRKAQQKRSRDELHERMSAMTSQHLNMFASVANEAAILSNMHAEETFGSSGEEDNT